MAPSVLSGCTHAFPQQHLVPRDCILTGWLRGSPSVPRRPSAGSGVARPVSETMEPGRDDLHRPLKARQRPKGSLHGSNVELQKTR